MTKILCLLGFISQESYIIWLSFKVQLCKMISRFFVVFFSKFWFSVFLGGKRPKNRPKWEKILSRSISQEPCIIWFSFLFSLYDIILGGVFFIFSKIWFSGVVRGMGDGRGRGKRAKNSQKWQKNLCRTW